jgi:hypothetical protein
MQISVNSLSTLVQWYSVCSRLCNKYHNTTNIKNESYLLVCYDLVTHLDCQRGHAVEQDTGKSGNYAHVLFFFFSNFFNKKSDCF